MTLDPQTASPSPDAPPLVLESPPEFSADEIRAVQDMMLAYLASEERARAPSDLLERMPVAPPLHGQMKPDLLVNDEGQVILIHEKPLPDTIWWADYDPEYKQLVFVSVTGQLIPFGMPIHAMVDAFLRHARVMYFIEIDQSGKMIRTDERAVVVRKNGRE